ncbi:YcaO-like family protein [Lentzea sp.]|uniref:YcaO-like family protein n=1 Tax=Lentzea sp. TaxID=56099 RepID=UPI002B56F51D|nr:YcaO-like family protein [Lentzea sp.]HUQ59586.1 YcaO-like family protein [Lentzea sp.]
MPEAIAYRTGAYRAVDPAETWQRVEPALGRFGITRVADITRLDEIGLPVHVAYRPSGLTYAVSMGFGVTVAHSRVSAVMESIEAWHAENLRLPVVARAPAAALDLGYDVRGLILASRSPLTSRVVLDWASGYGLLTGREVLAPVDSVRLDGTEPRDWATVLFRATSEGLATGNTEAEAVLHGLLELVERASLVGRRTRPGRYVDPGTCGDPVTSQIYAALRAAGCTVVVRDVTGPTGLPCYTATIWSCDVPMRCAGFACHLNPETALGRALGEAVLTRLAAISGARDDIDGVAYREMAEPVVPAALADVRDHDGWVDDGDLRSVIRHCASLVAAATGFEPFAVRLTHEDIGIPAVKVFTPGLRDLGRASS